MKPGRLIIFLALMGSACGGTDPPDIEAVEIQWFGFYDLSWEVLDGDCPIPVQGQMLIPRETGEIASYYSGACHAPVTDFEIGTHDLALSVPEASLGPCIGTNSPPLELESHLLFFDRDGMQFHSRVEVSSDQCRGSYRLTGTLLLP